MQLLTLPVADVVPLTPRTRLVRIDLLGRSFDFRAGQAVRLRPVDMDDRRAYSIACSPRQSAETGLLELLIAIETTGSLGAAVRHAQTGTLVEVEGPIGTFTFPRHFDQPDVLFVAGGTGIAPLRAMLDEALRNVPRRRISVLYSARSGDEFAFIEEFRALAQSEQIALHETVTREHSVHWEGARGRVGRGHFEAVLRAAHDTLCFVCGPPPMVIDSVATLESLGVPRALIRTEEWVGKVKKD